MFKYYLAVFFLLLVYTASYARDDILDAYIKEGLENNLALKQKQFSLEKSFQAIKEARSRFFPSISIESRYSRAEGGRSIEFPIGDLMNPVHLTLNDLLSAQGQDPIFPANIQNESIPFMQEKEQDTKIRAIQPIFNPSILYSYRIKKDLNDSQREELATFKRHLISEIKTAYFTYLKTVRIVELYEKTRELLVENLRVSTKLFKNHKVTEEVVFRARAELSKLDQDKEEAFKNLKVTRSYFNFLLNRSLDSTIEIIPVSAMDSDTELDLQYLESHALDSRTELNQLRYAMKATENSIRLSKSAFLPSLTGVFDYGFQGETYRFSGEDDYLMASLVFQWELFNGFQNRSRKEQAVLENIELQSRYEELKNMILLQVQEAFYNVSVARKTIVSADERLLSERKSFEIVRKKFEQGMVNQIEFIETRTSLTNAEIEHIIATYDYHIKFAELEEVAALQELYTILKSGENQ